MSEMKITDKMLRKLADGREYRRMTMQVRASENDDEMIVDGYATTFNTPYTLLDTKKFKIIEKVAPTAFDECDMSDVIFQYDHEGRVFARNRNNTLWLNTDNVGLFIKANLGGTDIGRQLYQEIKGGYTDRMSFGFIVGEDERLYTKDPERDLQICTRTITQIKKLFDVSAVSMPANDMTSISARNYADGVIAEFEAERLKAQKIKKLKLMMEV